MKKTSLGLMLLGAVWGSTSLTGCPSSTSQVHKSTEASNTNTTTTNSSNTAVVTPSKRHKFVPLRKRLEPLPAGIQTLKVKKKQDDVLLYLYPKGVLSSKPLTGTPGKWKARFIPIKRHRSWFIRLEPEEGASLGIYTSVSLIMAVFNSAGGYATTSRFSVRFLLRRGDKETELFRTMLLARGQRYKYYGVNNREIATKTRLQKGDILIFRVVHRTGSSGAVGVGGVKVGLLGPRFMISKRQIGNFYQYTK